MFRWLLRNTRRVSARACVSRRTYNTNPADTYTNLPPIRVLGPTVWCFTAAGAIYLGCATYEVRQDVKEINQGRLKTFIGGPYTFDVVEAARGTARRKEIYAEPKVGMSAMTSPVEAWQHFSGPSKFIATTVGLNTGLYALGQLSPSVWMQLAHLPSGPLNYTLLTSMFGHTGLPHLALNMYALTQFGSDLARSPTIQGSGSHLTAFYLSSGIMASLAAHLATIWPKPQQRMAFTLGASGGIMAIVGAFAMSYPTAGIGIIFLPGYLPAQQALAGLALFEAYGLFVGFKFINFAHAAHLGGVAIGAAYVHFEGHKHLWVPARRFAFNQMQKWDML